jgi:hypothetical protein
MATPSNAPDASPARMKEAVWYPPVLSTGTDKLALMARASSKLMPSIGNPFFIRNHIHRKIGRSRR